MQDVNADVNFSMFVIEVEAAGLDFLDTLITEFTKDKIRSIPLVVQRQVLR